MPQRAHLCARKRPKDVYFIEICRRYLHYWEYVYQQFFWAVYFRLTANSLTPVVWIAGTYECKTPLKTSMMLHKSATRMRKISCSSAVSFEFINKDAIHAKSKLMRNSISSYLWIYSSKDNFTLFIESILDTFGQFSLHSKERRFYQLDLQHVNPSSHRCITRIYNT